ncbi:hypothetical protein GGS24DRAFT_474494 [Hypoxylon argillaceum]|nr:hypothetical protein GGS24DRAFT_474494 [Hypoxylon argillaceum]
MIEPRDPDIYYDEDEEFSKNQSPLLKPHRPRIRPESPQFGPWTSSGDTFPDNDWALDILQYSENPELEISHSDPKSDLSMSINTMDESQPQADFLSLAETPKKTLRAAARATTLTEIDEGLLSFRPKGEYNSRDTPLARAPYSRATSPATSVPIADIPTPPADPFYTPVTPFPIPGTKTRRLRNARTRKRYKLLVVIEGLSGSSEVLALPDTGSDENIISLDLVRATGLSLIYINKLCTTFVLANGKTVQSIGQVVTKLAFARPSAGSPAMDCLFHVFQTLVVPLIVGMGFLEETETLTAHRDRLFEELMPAMQNLSVSSVGRPRRQLLCQIDQHVSLATADTGSDLDLVSPEFATSKNFDIAPAFEKIEFADGSFGMTCGVIEATLRIGSSDLGRGLLSSWNATTIERDFYILDNLTSSIVIGIDTLQELGVFSQKSECLFSSANTDDGGPDANVIRYVGRFESVCKETWRKFKEMFGGAVRNNNTGIEGIRERQAAILFDDQRENARREEARKCISGMEGSLKERAQVSEDQSIEEYEIQREQRLAKTAEIAAKAYPFLCLHPGCNVSFQTQYLLDSHANTHSKSHRYYCPVARCPRAEGGKGFRRKNEMIRHGLVHEGLDYTCPFCPDREHKYRVPNNLRRHVRVHHTDKDRNDPALQDVLYGGSHLLSKALTSEQRLK